MEVVHGLLDRLVEIGGWISDVKYAQQYAPVCAKIRKTNIWVLRGSLRNFSKRLAYHLRSTT